MTVLALCPSRSRPRQAGGLLDSFRDTVRDPGSRLVFILDADDPSVGEYPGEVVVYPPGGNMGAALHRAGWDPDVLRDASLVGMVGDDNRFRTPGWDVRFLELAASGPSVLYGDDGFQHERLPTAWWVSRSIVDVLGIVDRGLRHYYMDNVWKDLGEAAGILRYVPDVEIEHLHPLAGKGEDDAIYRRGGRNAAHDRAYYRRWKRAFLPAQARQIRALLPSTGGLRVLADWHHPALWESLSMLLEDRFGWELFSPLGIEWARRGAWQFSLPSIGWTAADYLEHPTAVPVDDHYTVVEREYPERPRKLVTWEQAHRQRWDVVLSSVSLHQRPFHRLARQWGARLVHQVGNARHAIDRSVPQVILASALVPGLRGAIPYHQEFSRALFAPRPPGPHSGAPRVRSFMLRLATTSGPYEWLAEDPGIDWADVGGVDPRSGSYLAPMSRVAAEMTAADFVWHDKLIGDGYGHVIHGAASIGRPLIGHAGNYRGMLGAALWRDLETCIDLDRHPPERAVRLVKAIAADPSWLGSMSQAMIDTFEGLVDFDAEASRIREALA